MADQFDHRRLDTIFSRFIVYDRDVLVIQVIEHMNGGRGGYMAEHIGTRSNDR